MRADLAMGAAMVAFLKTCKSLVLAALIAVCSAPLAIAQGVPVIDGGNLAQSLSRLEEAARDAINQDTNTAAKEAQTDLYQEQIDAYERFLDETTGATDLSNFEEGGPGFASAADTYPVEESHPDADRLFGDNQDVERMIITVARRYETHPGVAAAGLNPLTWRILFQSLVKQESRFNNAAVSPVGARGFTQLMPGTASDLGVNPYDPWENLDGGARYILAQLNRFGRVDHALGAYNAGPGRIIEYGGVPPFKETQTYVRRINGYFNEYRSVITGVDMTGSLAGVDGASAAWGNWGDASIGYGQYMGAQVDQAMERIAVLLREDPPTNPKEAMDRSTYMLAERGRLMGLLLRQRAAMVKVEAAAGITGAAEDLEISTFWRYANAAD